MMQPGLVSATFRQLPAEEIMQLAISTGLVAIEWSGDVHVPPGDQKRARHTARLTRAAGLQVAGYASYYIAGHSEGRGLAFDTALSTAAELGAPVIRVWAGQIGSSRASPLQREQIAADLRRIAGLAEKAGIRVSLEFHAGTLTDSTDSLLTLLQTEAAHPNLRTHWQPALGMETARALAGLQAVQPWLETMHVFHWATAPVQRLPLSAGMEPWRQFLAAAPNARHALLEFVAHDDPQNLVRDAATLHQLLASLPATVTNTY